MVALNGFIYGTIGRNGDETYAQKADIGLCTPVRWAGGKDARELAGRTVQIAVELASTDCGRVYTDSPRLYAVNLAAR